MKNIKGPLIYDSLDHVNADQNKTVAKPINYTHVWIVFILVIAAIFAALVIYVLFWLNMTEAAIALWIINGAIIFAIVGSVCAGVFYLFVLALRHAMLSLNDGVQVSVFSVLFARYDRAFEGITTRYFNMWDERMKQSMYSGVSTLTLDQSSQVETSTTSVKTDNGDEDITAPALPVSTDKSILEDLHDKGLIGRSNNSIAIGFTNE
jgi:hypothetical protein